MGFNTGMSEDDVEELRRGYEVEIGGLESELATLRAQLEDFRASQHYRYIGADGKTVLARNLEDERDALRDKNERLLEALSQLVENASTVMAFVNDPTDGTLSGALYDTILNAKEALK